MEENLLPNSKNKKIRVGVVRVLKEGEPDHAFLRASDFFKFLQENLQDDYTPLDIFIDKENVWHIGGLPVMPADLFHKIDVAWNEGDASISQVFSKIGIPYVGANPFFAALENNKVLLKEHIEKNDLYMPRHLVLESYQEDIDGDIEKYSFKKAQEVFQKFGAPWIVRTNTNKNNEGIHVIKTFPELINIIYDFAIHKKNILVEELISGDRVSLHTVANFRNQDIYHFLPKNIPSLHKEQIIKSATDLWKVLDAKHYMNINFILHPRRVYLDSVSSSIDLEKDNDFNVLIDSFGVKREHIIEHILKNAIIK